MLPVKPLAAVKVKTSVVCTPRDMLTAGTAGLTVKSSAVNVAVTACVEFIVTLHTFGSVPVQAPLHPAKLEFPAGTAVSATAVLGGKPTEHGPPALPQLIPPELLVTLPFPVPATVTLSMLLR